MPGERRETDSAIAVTAYDGTVPCAVIVLEDRIGGRTDCTWDVRVEDERPLLVLPAIVSAGTAGRLKVHLFAGPLADIGDQQVAGLAVEAEAPGIAKT